LEQSCDKEIQSKTGRRKFCSDKCKMKHFRKHGKKNVATKFDIQGMINEFKAMVQEFAGNTNHGQVPTLMTYADFEKKSDKADFIKPTTGETFTVKVSPEKTFEQFREAKRECESEEDWNKLKFQIENAVNLTAKQKNLLINYA